jgi:hypothetical protein
MAIKKTIEIDVDVVRANGGLENFTQNFKQSEEAAKSLRTQLREAQAEVATLSEKFGATSREAVEAAKKAAELKDRIGDIKATVNAFNPGVWNAAWPQVTVPLNGGISGFFSNTLEIKLGKPEPHVAQMGGFVWILTVPNATALCE